MNAVEIEEAVSALAIEPYDRAEFPYAFLAAFGNKETALQRLRAGGTNSSDIPEGVLLRNQIHLATCDDGRVAATLTALRTSPKNAKGKPKFLLATDGVDLEAEELGTGEVLACKFSDMANHFGFFLPLAGISTVAEIKNNPIDIKATSRLNKLYVELLRENPDWATAERRPALNQFLVRLIFCFFAEDTGIFASTGLFSTCIQQMTAADSSNTHEVIAELFRAMNTPTLHNDVPDSRYRDEAKIKSWARPFPYVNGKLFERDIQCPRFSKIARSYLIRAGELDWKQINPDIFGSMIQAVADDDERGELGMHYTSVPNILKVLDPLFLDDLRGELDQAENNPRKLLNLRKRLANIRVFDPACGSGNFLVIAYIRLRELEAEITKRRGEQGDAEAQKTWIRLTNFFGIELKSFAAEVARLSLLIAEFQCNVRLIGQREACLDVLPLHETGRIVNDNALRVDWTHICPPEQKATTQVHQQKEFDTQNEHAHPHETYICGNPPFTGTRKQSDEQKLDLEQIFAPITTNWKNVDYVAGWFLKAAQYNLSRQLPFAFVATNSLCQGQQIPLTWKIMGDLGFRIRFAYTSFQWKNLAANKAGVTVIIVGLDAKQQGTRKIYADETVKTVNNINPYLTQHDVTLVAPVKLPRNQLPAMEYGVYYSKSSALILDAKNKNYLLNEGLPVTYIRKFIGSTEFINGKERYCLWLNDEDLNAVLDIADIKYRLDEVRKERLMTSDVAVQRLANRPHQFREKKGDESWKLFVPIVSSQSREFFPAGLADHTIVPTNKAFYAAGAPLWTLSVLVSKLHMAWIATICGRLRMDYSFSNILGWNTFPVPPLTENQKADLTRCAEDILLAREQYWPATIADMYDPERMDTEFPLVREAHERNDENLERIYMGRRFKNDTERLEKLFDMYTKMTAAEDAAPVKKSRRSKSTDESTST